MTLPTATWEDREGIHICRQLSATMFDDRDLHPPRFQLTFMGQNRIIHTNDLAIAKAEALDLIYFFLSDRMELILRTQRQKEGSQ